MEKVNITDENDIILDVAGYFTLIMSWNIDIYECL
jgi:hypothetical protein